MELLNEEMKNGLPTTDAKFSSGEIRDVKFFLPWYLNCRGIKTWLSSSRQTI